MHFTDSYFLFVVFCSYTVSNQGRPNSSQPDSLLGGHKKAQRTIPLQLRVLEKIWKKSMMSHSLKRKQFWGSGFMSPLSPGLALLDFFLWGNLKETVYRGQVTTENFLVAVFILRLLFKRIPWCITCCLPLHGTRLYVSICAVDILNIFLCKRMQIPKLMFLIIFFLYRIRRHTSLSHFLENNGS